jgi:hypothetical protein
MKTVSVSEAKGRFEELVDEVLSGVPVLVRRGRRQVILRRFEPFEAGAGEAEFNAAFPPAPREPRGAAVRVSRAIRRVRGGP